VLRDTNDQINSHLELTVNDHLNAISELKTIAANATQKETAIK
jgi:hypothetical protein